MILKLIRKGYIQKVHYCTNTSKKKLYSNTVLLPKTSFPLRLENNKLLERDEKLNKVTNSEDFYKWQMDNLSNKEYILHDGPPYANGDLHMGHALNKILKDTILRYNILKGNKIHYIPGWDCHGLPIELKALSNSKKLDPIQIRKKAQEFAVKTVEKQMNTFKSWGILGDWTNHYRTLSPEYVKNELRMFYNMYDKGLIYRDVKPIYWSPSSGTALAEAELEYNEQHTSKSVYVQVEVKSIPNFNFLDDKKIFAVIWTTTPWTLPSNQAISYNEKLRYAFVKRSDYSDPNIYIVANDLLNSFLAIMNCKCQVLGVHPGNVLAGATYVHPVYKSKEGTFVHADHVSASKGTGLVHTAPAHGHDDFLVALKHKIPILDLVDENGVYKQEAGDQYAGKSIFDTGLDAVLETIKENILKSEGFVHSYPYDWRTKKPVIIRASQQWFINTDNLKDKAIEVLNDVNIIPKTKSEMYKSNLVNQIKRRPYWCISRQRKWGVPIPVFYEKGTKNVIINEDTINHYCSLIDKHGTDFWWQLNTEELLPENNKINSEKVEKGEDILDIWFDSGITWSKVVEDYKVADMYLEGVDQLTGWFQSSLLTSVAIRNKAPYKNLYVHGFVVDENGNKMSKSLGNVVDPTEIVKGGKKIKPYGVDVLRWWVACHGNQDSMAHVSSNILKSCQEEIHKVRSVLRFALGALNDYDYIPVDYNNLLLVDKYMLHLLHQFHSQVKEYSNDYQFHKICFSVLNLLTTPVSALYYTSIKDRLYCDFSNSITRRSAQYVLFQIFEIISQSIAPIVPHLAEEMFMTLPQQTDSYFKTSHSQPQEYWKNEKIGKTMDVVLKIKKEINRKLPLNTISSEVNIKLPLSLLETIKETVSFEDCEREFVDIFQVAAVKLEATDVNEIEVNINDSKYHACPRCRKVQALSADALCKRCNDVVNIDDNKTALAN